MNARDRFIQAAMKRLETVQPNTVFYQFEMGEFAGTYPAEVEDVLTELHGMLVQIIELGVDPEVAEHDMGMLAIMYLVTYDMKDVQEKTEASENAIPASECLTLDQNEIVKRLLASYDARDTTL